MSSLRRHKKALTVIFVFAAMAILVVSLFAICLADSSIQYFSTSFVGVSSLPAGFATNEGTPGMLQVVNDFGYDDNASLNFSTTGSFQRIEWNIPQDSIGMSGVDSFYYDSMVYLSNTCALSLFQFAGDDQSPYLPMFGVGIYSDGSYSGLFAQGFPAQYASQFINESSDENNSRVFLDGNTYYYGQVQDSLLNGFKVSANQWFELSVYVVFGNPGTIKVWIDNRLVTDWSGYVPQVGAHWYFNPNIYQNTAAVTMYVDKVTVSSAPSPLAHLLLLPFWRVA